MSLTTKHIRNTFSIIFIISTSILSFSQKDTVYNLSTKDNSYSAPVRVISNDAKDIAPLNFWFGLGKNQTGLYELFGFTYAKNEKFLMNLNVGNGFLFDIDIPFIRKQKRTELSQTIYKSGSKSYIAKLPSINRNSLNFRVGTGYAYYEFSAAHVRTGLSFLTSQHAEWRNLKARIRRKGGRRVVLNADVIYYFHNEVTNDHLQYYQNFYNQDEEKAQAYFNLYKNSFGYDVHLDFFATFWNELGRKGFRFTIGNGTPPNSAFGSLLYGKVCFDLSRY